MVFPDSQTIKNRLRLGSSLILFVFVTGHLINHALGLISLQAMQSATAVFIGPWRTWPGTIFLGGALVVHISIALWSFWTRRNFKLRSWEAVQLLSGLAIPPLLGAHIAANLVLPVFSAYEGTYREILALFAVYAPVRGMLMVVSVLTVWTHACVGLHSWLRIKQWYQRYQQLAFAMALLIPALSLAGYLAASMRIMELAAQPGGLGIDYSHVKPWMVDFVYRTEVQVIAIVLLVIAIRFAKSFLDARRNKLRLTYAPGDRAIALLPGATLLESIRAAGIPHASICGGRGRCSTCRVHIVEGQETLPPPTEAEFEVLARVTGSPSVRLACQIRPQDNINVVALVADDAKPGAALARPGYQQGREMKVTVLFVDLRGSTKLCEERLPFDVVFVLNQFFAELSKALTDTNGHYAQFAGDGLMAIYGLESGTENGAAEAVNGALSMLARLDELNKRLKMELAEGLKIGIGIHTGEAIVGSMGPPASPIVSALGDNVNIAARLESQTKDFGVPLVVSAEAASASGFNFSKFKKHSVQVKGRGARIAVYAVDKPEGLSVNR